MKYIGLFDEKEDIVTKEKLDAVKATIPTKTSQLDNDSGFITSAPVTSVNTKTGAVTLSASDVGAQPTITVNGIIKGDGAGNLSAQDTVAAELVDLPTVPTKVSELANDANYITADQAPVKSVNGKTGNVTVSTTFVAYRLGNSSATCTFAEMLEAWKRGDICILRYGADGMLEYQLFAVVDNESITFTYVDGDIIREIVWTADGNFTDNNIEKSTNLSASSTNNQFPTSKAVWDAIPRPSTTTPLAPTEAGAVGTSTAYARGDHSHPSEVFWCTVTDDVMSENYSCDKTYAEIVAAYNAGKICIVKYGGLVFQLDAVKLAGLGTKYVIFKSSVDSSSPSSGSSGVVVLTVTSTNTVTVEDEIVSKLPNATKITLTVAGWDSTAKTQFVTAIGVLADVTKQEIRVMPVNAALDSPYIAAGIQCVAQAANSLTFACETVPTEAIEVYVVIQDVNYSV